MGTAAWDLLEKPWKGLLLVALDKEEPTGGEDGAKRGASRSRRMRNRGRRGRGSGTEDWLEGMGGLVTSTAPPGYRLAAMLVQRARMGDAWNPTWDASLEQLRDACAEGVHPVWPAMGKEAPLLAELSVYPPAEGQVVLAKDPTSWLEGARIDPMDRSSLADWLSISPPYPLSAELKLSIQRLSNAFRGKGRAPRLPTGLTELEAEASLVRALARIGAGVEGADADLDGLADGEGPVAVIAADHLSLLRLRAGDASAWAACRAADGEDALSAAMRHQAWSDAPEDADLSAAEILCGLEELEAGDDGRGLQWSLVAAHLREGDVDAAVERAASLGLSDGRRLPLLLNLLEICGDAALTARLVDGIGRFSADDLVHIMEATKTPIELRAAAASGLQSLEGEAWADHRATGLDLFTELGDAACIGSILMEMEDGAESHPHRTLLVHHLLPAHAHDELAAWVAGARPRAMAALAKESTGVLSDASVGLIKLLEGAPADLGSVNDGLDRGGVQAFNQCRRAMMEDGDGLVATELLDTLESSVQGSSLSAVEVRLFGAVIDTLRFNRALRLLESDLEESTVAAEATLSDLIGTEPRKRTVDDVRHVVLEHGVAVPTLAEWHRLHAASTGWHQVILASIDDQRGNILAAARAMRRASRDLDFVFEDQVRIARRALINFAHAGQWSEAVEMLEAQPALQSALTALFQLYLKVCDDVKRDQPEAARGRLMEWIARTEITWVENVDGEKVEQRRTTHNSDDLDMLFTYPTSHPKPLPVEPWQGRVRAAFRNIRENRRSARSQLEARFRHNLADKAGVQDIESIAEEAADLDPTQGLMMFERAMNSGQFSNNELRALHRSQNAIYALNQNEIPIRARRALRNLALKPLVLVDTNLLIDAAKERIGRLLESDAGLDTQTHGAFHRTILHRANSGQVELLIPAAAMGEFEYKMASLIRVRSLFNDVWMDEVEWVETVTLDAVQTIADEIKSDYNTWLSPSDDDFGLDETDHEEELAAFLVDHVEIYRQVADMKLGLNPDAVANRTVIDGEAIYPERGDLDIMGTAAKLAGASFRGIGSVLIATRDSDFCLVRRALEESFGFGVVRSARELGQFC